MIELESDLTQNLVIIRYRGCVTAEETAANLDRVKATIALMQPGFGLLADLTALDTMESACAPHIRETMDFANSHQVAAVVRVVPDPQRDIGMEIMSRFHYGPDVQTFTCATVEEAMRLLFD